MLRPDITPYARLVTTLTARFAVYDRRPARFVFVEALLTTATGKILRLSLRECECPVAIAKDDPRVVNDGPVGLARFTTLRSWLSQWSYDDSRADGIGNAARVRCPVIVINNTADLACTPSHAKRLFEAIGHADKELHQIAGADHYYLQAPEKALEAVGLIEDWMRRKDFA